MDSEKQIKLPYEKTILTLGILSIVIFLCGGIFGIVLSLIGGIMAYRQLNLFKSYPKSFLRTSYNSVKTGLICNAIGFCLSVIFFIYVVDAIQKEPSDYKVANKYLREGNYEKAIEFYQKIPKKDIHYDESLIMIDSAKRMAYREKMKKKHEGAGNTPTEMPNPKDINGENQSAPVEKKK